MEALHDPDNGIVCLRDFVQHDQLRVYYKAADVHVSASDFETLGNSCHEALLCGTPVVLERAGGYLSQVDDGEQGFLVHWADAAQARDAIEKGALMPSPLSKASHLNLARTRLPQRPAHCVLHSVANGAC